MNRRHSQEDFLCINGFIAVVGAVILRQSQKADIQIAMGNQFLKVADSPFPGGDGDVGVQLMKGGILSSGCSQLTKSASFVSKA